MTTFLFIVLICQTRNLKVEVIQHDPLRQFTPAFAESIQSSSDVLRELTKQASYDKISTELKQRSTDWSKDKASQIVGLGELLNIVANTPVLPESKGWVYGKHDERIRAICRPHVLATVSPELSIPAHTEVLSAQITTALNFVSFNSPKDLENLKQDAEQRREMLQRTSRVWGRLVRTCLVHKETYPEEKLAELFSGDSKLEVPPLPKIPRLGPFASGSEPESIQDPQARKQYEAYLKSVQDVRDRFQAAKTVSLLRTSKLKIIRRQLEYLYGEDRTKWDELRQIVIDTTPDADVAQLVIKDFTRRKEPGLWP